MVWALVLLAGSTTFAGGSVNDFVTSVAKATGKNVIASIAEKETMPSITYDPSDPRTLYRALFVSPMRMLDNERFAFADELYVGTHFRPIAPDLPDGAGAAAKLKTPIHKDGLVTVDTSKTGPVQLKALFDEKWAKPIGVDFLMQDLALSIHVEKMPEVDFLKLLARSVGGNFENLGDHYSLSYDADAFKQRLRKTLLQQREEDHPTKIAAKRHLMISSLDAVAGVELLFREGGKSYIYPWDQFNFRLVQTYAQELRAADATPGELTDEDRKILNNVNWDALAPMGAFGGWIGLGPDGASYVSFPVGEKLPSGYSHGLPHKEV